MLTRDQIRDIVDRRVIADHLGTEGRGGMHNRPTILVRTKEGHEVELPDSYVGEFVSRTVACPLSSPKGMPCPGRPPGRPVRDGEAFAIADLPSGCLDARRDLLALLIADIVEEALQAERSGSPYR